MPLSPSSAPTVSIDPVKDVVLATFNDDVLEASRSAVVLVDFWLPRDSACKQLTASLEKLARGSKGAVRLAKIDVERNQPIIRQMGVTSVPSVFAFYQGRPLDAFAGILPDAEIKTWLDNILKTTGAGGEEKAGLKTAFKQAAEHLARGDIATARAIYADILDMEKENAAAYAGLARCLIQENKIPEARKMLDAAPAAIAKDKALDSVRAAVEVAEEAGKSEGQAEKLEAALKQNPDDHETRFALALAYYAAGRKEDAVDQLLDLVRRARAWNDGAARKQLVKFFEAFGSSDPLTVSSRKRLSSILFS
jgi:putative thioredoxin